MRAIFLVVIKILFNCVGSGTACEGTLVNAGLKGDRFIYIIFNQIRELLELLERKLFESGVILDAVVYELAGDGMCLTERNTFTNEVVS